MFALKITYYIVSNLYVYILKTSYLFLIYFNIKSLSHRRLISDMVLTFKIINGLVDVKATPICDTYM